jgi:hypothetical protein
MVRINTNQQELEYQGIFFPFSLVKSVLLNTMPEETFLRHCIHRTFNPTTGKIQRKYVWDAVFQDLHTQGRLSPVLDEILKKEELQYDTGTTQKAAV